MSDLDPAVAELLAAIRAAERDPVDPPAWIAAAVDTAACRVLERGDVDVDAAARWLRAYLAGRANPPVELAGEFQRVAERRPGGAAGPSTRHLDGTGTDG